ncbi:MAG: 5'-methylthioadenosine/adenosylhomocysteine nucleosidase [Ruminococcaceae bacterium]|nr:5'-methylthioadenosine/adenosylhomocysteine nucleosidase [Oscillospiraceae bacterium]
MKLGIIGAMKIEVEALKNNMESKTVVTRAGMEFCDGILEGLPTVVVQCGVGKVNAAMCVQVLCDCFGVTHLLNTGIAGSLSNELDIGDLVISKDVMYHDFDCVGFGYAYGQVPGMDVITFSGDQTMMDYALAAAEAVNPGHSKVGRIATGDQFVCDKERKNAIIERTQALCTEMEGGAIAHAAYRNGIPFVILRAISDKADDSAEMDYPAFEAIAANRCAAVAQRVAQKLRGI